jgi:hypothetical protein
MRVLVVLVLGILGSCTSADTGLQKPPGDSDLVLGIHHLKGSNAVATHGKLVLRHGCVMLDLHSFVEMLAWPRDFTVDKIPRSFLVRDGQERIVAKSGDRLRLGGGPIGPGAIYSTDNHALPSRCLTDHMFAVGRGMVHITPWISRP